MTAVPSPGSAPGDRAWWHLYGTVVEGAGYSAMVLLGDTVADVEPQIRSMDILGAGPKITLPLLGSWDHRPTIVEKNAVLAPGMEPESQSDNCDEYGDILDDEDDW